MHDAHPPSEPADAGVAQSFAYMVEKVRDYAIFLTDRNGVISTWNPSAQAMKGYTADEIIGKEIDVLYPDDEREAGRPQHNLDMAAQHGTYQEEGWRRRKDGSLFWALVEIIAIIDRGGDLSGFCKITRDLSERKTLQDALQREKDRAQITLRAIGDGVVSVDAGGRVEFVNPKAEELTGWTDEAARGRPLDEVLRLSGDAPLHAEGQSLFSWMRAGAGPSPVVAAILHSRDGRRYAIEENMTPILGSDGRFEGGVVVFRDVTASREHLRSLSYQAAHDPLTGLVNRAEFEKRLERAREHTRMGATSSALIYLDLDRFKAVNDTCGHEAGDELLRRLAQVYIRQIRDRDTLARIGGDEFALIIDHCTRDEARAVAEKILRATSTFQFDYCGRSFGIGVSIGIAMFGEGFGTSEEILQAADRACYLAKATGRNRIQTQSLN